MTAVNWLERGKKVKEQKIGILPQGPYYFYGHRTSIIIQPDAMLVDYHIVQESMLEIGSKAFYDKFSS